MPSSTEWSEDYLVRVDSEGHEGEWLQMVACPIPHCGATRGEDYHKFAVHLAEHGPEDLGLSPGRRVATDGGTVESGTERCPECGRYPPEEGHKLDCPEWEDGDREVDPGWWLA